MFEGCIYSLAICFYYSSWVKLLTQIPLTSVQLQRPSGEFFLRFSWSQTTNFLITVPTYFLKGCITQWEVFFLSVPSSYPLSYRDFQTHKASITRGSFPIFGLSLSKQFPCLSWAQQHFKVLGLRHTFSIQRSRWLLDAFSSGISPW